MTDLQTNQRLLFLEGAIRRLTSGNVPAGGTTGQVLTKASSADYDLTWADMGIAGDGTYTVCDGAIDATGTIIGAFFDFTEGAP